jgi:hypothetical protein
VSRSTPIGINRYWDIHLSGLRWSDISNGCVMTLANAGHQKRPVDPPTGLFELQAKDQREG